MKNYQAIEYRSEDTTVERYLNEPTSIAYGWGVTDFLGFLDENGVTNIEYIYSKYSGDEKVGSQEVYLKFLSITKSKSQQQNLGTFSLTNQSVILSTPVITIGDKEKLSQFVIKEGTRLNISYTALNKEGLYGDSGGIIKSISYKAFMSERLRELLTDVNYKRVHNSNRKFLGVSTEYFPRLTVWLWCRSLTSPNSKELDGTVIDITPFVQNISTTVSENGGSFTLEISSIAGEFNSQKGFSLKNYKKYFYGENNYVSQQDVHKINEEGELERNISFFNTVIGENDIIFIRYETLVNEIVTVRVKENELQQMNLQKEELMEGSENIEKVEISVKNRLKEQLSQEFEIPKSELPGKIYDMIGLVDTNTISTKSGEVTVSVQGRDLLKLFQDDGCYFFPMDFVPGGIFANENQDKYLERLDGKLIGLTQSSIKSIDYCISFIFNALSSIRICPSSVFDSYGSKRSSGYKNNLDDLKKKSSLNQELESIRTKVVGTIKKIRKGYGFYTDLAYNESVFNTIYYFLINVDESQVSKVNTINGLIQGWSSYDVGIYKGKENEIPSELIQKLSKVPDSNINLLKSNTKEEKAKYKKSDFTTLGYTFGQMTEQLLKLKPEISLTYGKDLDIRTIFNDTWSYIQKEREIDSFKTSSEIEKLKGIWSIIDLVIDKTSEAGNVGSKRVLDVNFGNENGSLMNLIPKICQRPFVEFYSDTYKDKFSLIVRQPPFTRNSFLELIELAIDIDDSDVISDSFSFDTSQAYSWYRLQPQWLASSFGDAVVPYYIKAVHFQEYAEVWGEKPLEMVSNYYPYLTQGNNKEKQSANLAVSQSLQDLKYLVDIHSYLPFTRKGTITIKGNRTIKRGTIVRYKPTGEVFYVDNVSNTFQISGRGIDRVTILGVSRGMIEEYKEMYFKIIETPVSDVLKKEQEGDSYIDWIREIYKDWEVNTRVFDFFMRRQQFVKGFTAKYKGDPIDNYDNVKNAT